MCHLMLLVTAQACAARVTARWRKYEAFLAGIRSHILVTGDCDDMSLGGTDEPRAGPLQRSIPLYRQFRAQYSRRAIAQPLGAGCVPRLQRRQSPEGRGESHCPCAARADESPDGRIA